MKFPIHKLNAIFWIFFLLLLPITSLPFIAMLLGSSMVAAPSIVFMGLLALFWIVPKIFKREAIYISQPFLLFLLFAIISSLLAFFMNIPIQKNLSLVHTMAEGLITLLIGFGFFFLISNFISSEKILINTLQILVISSIPVFIWSGIQLGSWMFFGAYADWMVKAQSILSTSGNLYNGRVTGFAFEPSWFAHTLTIFYIPLWLGLSIQQVSIFQRKLFGVRYEYILLAFSVIFLIFSKSRVGLISLAFIFLFLIAKIHTFLVQQAAKMIHAIVKFQFPKRFISWTLIVIYAAGLILSIFFVSKFDKRMENLFDPATYQNQRLTSIANQFQFAERILYWQAGWRVFNDYPIFGVGLGNAGFYFEEKLPANAWAYNEPRNIFYRADFLPNNKNLWTKLLSETGILGFSAFFIWLLVTWSQAAHLKHHPDKLYRGIGYAGFFALIAFLIEGFSIDSFALPYYWFIPAVVSAVFQFQYLSPRKSESVKPVN